MGIKDYEFDAYGRTPTYNSWRGMIWRVDHDERYIAKGITVCPRWRTYEHFLADMGERPKGKSLDRIGNGGNYEPGNCRWATPKEQANNRNPYNAWDKSSRKTILETGWCKNKHDLDEVGVIFVTVRGKVYPTCRQCDLDRKRAYKQRQKQARPT